MELIFTEMLCFKSDGPVVDSANNEKLVSETK